MKPDTAEDGAIISIRPLSLSQQIRRINQLSEPERSTMIKLFVMKHFPDRKEREHKDNDNKSQLHESSSEDESYVTW